uniref:Uncharacterized protein n=1 Tax=uncultured bacterium 'To-T 020 P12' TaxID=1263626 RepID=K9NBV9_9BACT|nr:hypothetical protein [uncultured bacterium 'To-T 020 P12']
MTFSAKAVGLVASPHSDSIRPLLSGVLSAAGLELVDADQPDFGPLAGVIEVSDARTEAIEGSRCGSWPSFRLRLADGWDEARTVAFADSGTLPAVLRGRKVVTDVASDPFGTSMVGETLAESLSGPLWTSSTHGGHRHDTCLLPRPAVHERSGLFDHLNGRSFMGFLPVIDWARSLAGWQHWQKPPIRACFMIDDPNLHATRYGFVSYEGLAMEGSRHGFHTSLATVPLDQFYVSRAASDLLRKNTKVLSLLVHGNNHTHRELAGSETPSRRREMIRQALARIERLERKSGLSVARVMTPPHGACSAAMMSTLAHAGFDAACISHGSVHAANSGQVWSSGLGADPVAVINGLPVIPRFGLDRDMESQMLLSAYLGQPIVPMGHHWDFQDGVTALVNAADSIRKLGGLGRTCLR